MRQREAKLGCHVNNVKHAQDPSDPLLLPCRLFEWCSSSSSSSSRSDSLHEERRSEH